MECKLRDVTMHYEEAGSGKPVLILHGAPLNGRMTMDDFEPTFQTRTGWRRLYPDMPGHGKTSYPPSLRNHDDLIEIVLEFMDTVASGERFVVAGLSWGGYVARGVVHQRLKQVDGVMLYVPVIKLPSVERELPTRYVIRHDSQFAAMLQPGDEWLLDAATAQSLPLLDSIRANFLAYDSDHDPQVDELLYKAPFTFDPDDLPEPCPAPMLILVGRQDHWTGYRQAYSILENFPRGTYAVLDRAGHMLSYEQRPLALALVGEWLDRVEEYIAQNPS